MSKVIKVICTKRNSWYFTIGKEYLVESVDNYSYQIVNDKGFLGYFSKRIFSTIQELRDEKLDQLGI